MGTRLSIRPMTVTLGPLLLLIYIMYIVFASGCFQSRDVFPPPSTDMRLQYKHQEDIYELFLGGEMPTKGGSLVPVCPPQLWRLSDSTWTKCDLPVEVSSNKRYYGCLGANDRFVMISADLGEMFFRENNTWEQRNLRGEICGEEWRHPGFLLFNEETDHCEFIEFSGRKWVIDEDVLEDRGMLVEKEGGFFISSHTKETGKSKCRFYFLRSDEIVEYDGERLSLLCDLSDASDGPISIAYYPARDSLLVFSFSKEGNVKVKELENGQLRDLSSKDGPRSLVGSVSCYNPTERSLFFFGGVNVYSGRDWHEMWRLKITDDGMEALWKKME